MLCVAMPICLRLLAQVTRAAASRTFCTAGSNSPMRIAMMAMTTSNSISVKAERGRDMGRPPGEKGRNDEKVGVTLPRSCRVRKRIALRFRRFLGGPFPPALGGGGGPDGPGEEVAEEEEGDGGGDAEHH